MADQPETSDRLQERMRDNAAAAVDVAQRVHKVRLDYSADSIELLEKVLDEIHRAPSIGIFNWILRLTKGGSLRQVDVTVFGAYLGEVIRRQWGGTWARTDQVVLQVNENLVLSPLNKVAKRLEYGDEDNVFVYYQRSVAYARQAADA